MRSQLRSLLKKNHIECATPFKEVSNKLTFLYGQHLGVDRIDQNQFHDAPKKLNKKTAYINFEEAYRLIETKAEMGPSFACFSFDEVANNIVSALKDFDVNCCIFVNSASIEASNSLRENFMPVVSICVKRLLAGRRWQVLSLPVELSAHILITVVACQVLITAVWVSR